MNKTTRSSQLDRFIITKIDGRFYLKGARGATYVATAAFIGDDDTMKIVGGQWGSQVVRDYDGTELHVSLAAITARWLAWQKVN